MQYLLMSIAKHNFDQMNSRYPQISPHCNEYHQLRCIQPTPINLFKVNFVKKVPLQATSWNLDTLCYKSLERLNINAVPKRNLLLHLRGSSDERTQSSNCFSNSQVELWNQRYDELIAFYKQNNHCIVPAKYDKNQSLSHWVRRQRYQYRIKMEGSHSTLSDERQAILEQLGFVWDSHVAGWEARWMELRGFRESNGHANVPKNYKPDPSLAIWVKSQRRQFRLFSQGKKSTISRERIDKLLHLGFVFNPRSKKAHVKFAWE